MFPKRGHKKPSEMEKAINSALCHNLLRKHCHCELYVIPYCDVGRDYDGADDDGEGGDHDGGVGRWKGWPASFDGASCRQVGPGPV